MNKNDGAVEESEEDEQEAEIVRTYLKNHLDFMTRCVNGWKGSLNELKALCILVKHNAISSTLNVSSGLLKKEKTMKQDDLYYYKSMRREQHWS